MVNVEFEWFDPQEIDFQGLKVLLRQLLDADSDLFDLSALANLILSQPLLGSTVKVPEDGVETNQTDPFAFLTVLNLHTHQELPEIRTLISYLRSKAESIPSLATLPKLLSPESDAQVGLILSERFVNMPAEIVPPMYNMLLEEIQWANEEKEPYTFSHYLILSKTYKEIASKLDAMVITESSASPPPQKKSKKGKGGSGVTGETFYFHAEDEVFHRSASGFGDFRYTKQGGEGASDAKRAFMDVGIEPVGHMVLIEAKAFEGAVKAVGNYISPES